MGNGNRRTGNSGSWLLPPSDELSRAVRGQKSEPPLFPLNLDSAHLSLVYNYDRFKEWRQMRRRWLTVLILLLASGMLVFGAAVDCSFLANPNDFLVNTERIHTMRSDLSSRVQTYLYAASDATSTVDAPTIPHKNFIDDSIFNRMAAAGIKSAPLASDAEFLRRVTLDLTGRTPTVPDIDAFLIDTNPLKRDLKVD